MNTTAIGNRLEAAVHDHLALLIVEKRFLAPPECVALHRQKGYFSRDRNSEIVFDVSVEISMPGANDYSILYLVECKNEQKPIGVGKVEEFFAKAQQVGGGRVKCVLASSGAFQKGAIEFARSKGIGLLRCLDSTDFKWVLQRSPSAFGVWTPTSSEWPEIERGLTQSDYASTYYRFFAAGGSTFTNSVSALLLALADDDDSKALLSKVRNKRKLKKEAVAYLSSDAIDERAAEVLSSVGYEGGRVDLTAICGREEAETGMTTDLAAVRSEAEAARGVLGRISFDPLEVVVFDLGADQTARQRFTLAHELGHHFLGHGSVMAREYVEEADLVGGDDPALTPKYIKRMEIQANQFAASLLLPKTHFTYEAIKASEALGLRDKGHGLIYVDNQKCNLRSFYAVSDKLTKEYGVSREAVRVRLDRLGLLNDARRRATQLGSLLFGS